MMHLTQEAFTDAMREAAKPISTHLSSIDASFAVMAHIGLAKALYDDAQQRELLYQCVALIQASEDARQGLHKAHEALDQAKGKEHLLKEMQDRVNSSLDISMHANGNLDRFNASHPIIYRLAFATQRRN